MRGSGRKLTRRNAIQKFVGAAMLAGVSPSFRLLAGCGSTPDPTPSESEAMEEVAREFMRRFDVPGLSVCIAKQARIIYESALGFANRESSERVTSNTLFRIASVTKPITSTAIFTLIERGKLRQQDAVFGSRGVLGTTFGSPPYKTWVEDITIDHLLTHTCGGWSNRADDPMFANPDMNHAELISWTLDNRLLEAPPGTRYAYSNFGYCVLGRVIEHLSGRSYRDYLQDEILGPCNVSDMRIGGNTRYDQAPQEVVYYGQNGEDPYGMNVARMDSHGGWLATPRDLVSFLTHVDGFRSAPNILRAETIKAMTSPSAPNRNYARGWAVNNVPNWWHNGSLPGTSTIMVRTHSGFCWAVLTNSRTTGGPDIGLALDNLVWDMVRKVSAWHA